MRTRACAVFVLVAGLGLLAGCGGEPVAKIEGPTVKEFTGKLVHDGKPVQFADESVTLKVFHEKGQSFGIPIKRDGTFQIGWMPIGRYSANLLREKTAAGGKAHVPSTYGLPADALVITDGKTDYTIELGKGFKQ